MSPRMHGKRIPGKPETDYDCPKCGADAGRSCYPPTGWTVRLHEASGGLSCQERRDLVCRSTGHVWPKKDTLETGDSCECGDLVMDEARGPLRKDGRPIGNAAAPLTGEQ